ncbi:hypothetical protein P7C73_g3668, partial [Tremellales sp. Uapishka_1]
MSSNKLVTDEATLSGQIVGLGSYLAQRDGIPLPEDTWKLTHSRKLLAGWLEEVRQSNYNRWVDKISQSTANDADEKGFQFTQALLTHLRSMAKDPYDLQNFASVLYDVTKSFKLWCPTVHSTGATDSQDAPKIAALEAEVASQGHRITALEGLVAKSLQTPSNDFSSYAGSSEAGGLYTPSTTTAPPSGRQTPSRDPQMSNYRLGTSGRFLGSLNDVNKPTPHSVEKPGLGALTANEREITYDTDLDRLNRGRNPILRENICDDDRPKRQVESNFTERQRSSGLGLAEEMFSNIAPSTNGPLPQATYGTAGFGGQDGLAVDGIAVSHISDDDEDWDDQTAGGF